MEENEDRIEAFLAEQSGFEVLSISDVWADTLGGDAPCDDPYLRLTPARHGTDGFFLAVLQRKQT
jgi:16S rRNA (cytosine967-C5)-methyltransferase